MIVKPITNCFHKLSQISSALARSPCWYPDFEQVRVYCMFVGFPRSGHSLVGALLSAHPHMVISHELDALDFVRLNVPRSVLFSLILHQDLQFHRQGRRWTGHNYAVDNLWQGSYQRLTVIGDKKGGVSTDRLAQDPMLLEQLRATAGVPVKVIQVVRNPFDNISSIYRRSKRSFPQSIESYFERCRYLTQIRKRLTDDELMALHLEDLVADPHTTLARICEWLGVEPLEYFLDACADKIFKKPNRSSSGVDWSAAAVEQVARQMERFAFLNSYPRAVAS